MSGQQLRWGILSAANIARRAVGPAIQRSRNGRVQAVAGRDPDKTDQFATELAIPRVLRSYDELLADPEIDAIYIALPNSLHHEWTIKAAAAGKHILCEKPLALSAAQCLEMDAAAREHHVLLMEAFMYRFHPQTIRVRELIEGGTLGEVKLLRASFTFALTNPANIRLQPELGGGSLMDVGCYCVNVSRTMFDAEPQSVQAFATWSASGVDDRMVATLRFDGGRFAQFDCALTLPRREAYQIAGTSASLDVPVGFLPGTGDATIFVNRGTPGEKVERIPGVDEYQLMVEHFADCVLEGKPVRYPVAEAAANMRVIEALYRSARQDGTVERVA